MSILIKNMEMPKDGEMLCINIYPDGKVCINLDLDCRQIATAVPVPSHGDLIERSAASLSDFEIAVCDGSFMEGMKMLLAKIENAPTIIEAEGDKE